MASDSSSVEVRVFLSSPRAEYLRWNVIVKEDDVDTLKTAVVVVLLLAVLYGVYVVLNKPEQYSQDLAWEADAADPALQIELGLPEPSTASNDPSATSFPVVAWDTTNSGANSAEASPPALTNSSPSPAQLTADQGFNAQPSLPIPESTTAAAPALAAPDLISDSNLTSQASEATTAEDVSFKPEEAADSLAIPEVPTYSNELRDPDYSSPSYNSPSPTMTADQSGSSNRYSGYDPEANQPSAGIAPIGQAIAPATSTQANVNDLTDQPATSGAGAVQTALESAQMKIAAEAWYDALLKLSTQYNDPSMNAADFAKLVDMLDPLAGKVIYSREHLIEAAYKPQPGDTIENIAARYEVPWQLLANINGIENPQTLLAGRELKVVRGPFRAEISLSKNELTLFADKLYAGRFPINLGNDPAPLPGQYQVNDKQPGRTYYAAGSGQTIPIDDPNNPYGRVWIDLGSNLSIHGSSPNGTSPGQGCIALTARDANDVFGILSKGSSVVILR